MEYEEHEKRAWSVDFAPTEASMLVSGSDDGKVEPASVILLLFAELMILWISGIASPGRCMLVQYFYCKFSVSRTF